MKTQLRYIFLAAIIAILTIVGYQSYWLTDIYRTLEANLQRDTNEAMRAADFDEIVRRVEMLKDENIGGRLQVKVGPNESRDSVEVNQNYDKNYTEKPEGKKQDVAQEQQVEQSEAPQDNPLRFDDFANALRTEQDVINVGLQMQRGIHMGLDQLKPIDEKYYDEVLERRLDSLGIMGKRKLLHVRYAAADTLRSNPQLLFESKDINISKVDTFRFVIDPEGTEEYILLQEKSIFIWPSQLYSPILLSVVTLLVLMIAIWYFIRMLRNLWTLDEMKTDFTNNITHELKTPIAVAYAADDALLNFDASSDPTRLKKYLTVIQEQLATLSELVEQILSASMERRKNMSLEIDDQNVSEVVERVVANQRFKCTKPFNVSVDIPSSLTVKADHLHFKNIINNLVDNAIKYSGDSVTLDIKAQATADGHVEISFKDNGIGISSEQQRFIFDRFYRVPHGNLHDVKGYGLGLYYVKNMMQKFGGSVSLKSELGKGSKFKLIFNG